MVGCLKDEVRDGNGERGRISHPASAVPCSDMVQWLKVLNQQSPQQALLFTARWLLFFFVAELAAVPHSFTMPLSAHARNNGYVIWNDSLQSTIINVVIHF